MRGFYVAAVRTDEADPKPMIASGPFRSREDAARYVEPVRIRAEELDPVGQLFREIGTAAVDADPLPEAPGNELLGLAVLDGFVLTVDSLLDSMIGGAP